MGIKHIKLIYQKKVNENVWNDQHIMIICLGKNTNENI